MSGGSRSGQIGSPNDPINLGQRAPQSQITYPSPFFDIANTYLPRNIKSMFNWCRYYYYVNPLIHRSCKRLSRFPITDIMVETEDSELKKEWVKTLANINARAYAMDIGLDYIVYGNGFSSIHFPIQRSLKCNTCGDTQDVKSSDVEFKRFRYQGRCTKCKNQTLFTAIDQKIHDLSKVNLLHWNPEAIDIEYNDITGHSLYTYGISNNLKRFIKAGRRPVIDETEMDVIRHVQEQRPLRVHPGNIYHIKSSVLASAGMGWGFPDILSCLKPLFMAQVYQKAREVVAQQHIVPFWILFPSANADITPFENLDISKWRDRVEGEIRKWRRDPNYISIMPIPLGFQFIGGDFSNLNVAPDLQQISTDVLAGIGVPQEFIYGGMSWSGTSISARMLENDLYNYVSDIEEMFNCFIIPTLAKYIQLEPVRIRFKPIKMVDDVQQKNLRVGLAENGHISWDTILEEIGFDPSTEIEKLKKEQEDLAKIDGARQIENQKQQFIAEEEALRHQMRMQMIMPAVQAEVSKGAQKEYGEDLISSDVDPLLLDPHMYSRMYKSDRSGSASQNFSNKAWRPSPFDPNHMAKMYAEALSGMKNDSERTEAMGRLEQEMPYLHEVVMDHMNGNKPRRGNRKTTTNPSDLMPMPDQKPPRRPR